MRLYIEPSAWGGYANESDASAMAEVFERCRTGHYQLVISEQVEFELYSNPHTPPEVVQRYLDLLPYAEMLEITPEAAALQQAYVQGGVVGPARAGDALHVAIATVGDCTMLTTLDSKHIAKAVKVAGYNRVNQQMGYASLEILKPQEVLARF